MVKNVPSSNTTVRKTLSIRLKVNTFFFLNKNIRVTKISLDFPLVRMASIMGSAPCNLRVYVFNGVLLSLYSLKIPYLPFSVVIKVISPKN